jgi:VCBS repeat protein
MQRDSRWFVIAALCLAAASPATPAAAAARPQFTSPFFAFDAPSPMTLAMADMNGDGRNDLVTGGDTSVSVLLSLGGGWFAPRTDYSTGTRASGRHAVTWDGRGPDGARARPGMYFVELRQGAQHAVRRAVLLQ